MTMQATDLVQQLHRLLKQHPEGLNQISLMTGLSTSPDQLQQAFAQLKDEYAAPLEFNTEQRLWRYRPDGADFEIPGLSLTAGELRSLITVITLLDDLNDGISADVLGDSARQIEAMMRSHGLDPTDMKRRVRILSASQSKVNNRIYRQVSEALFNRHCLDIRYVARDQSLSERTVSPQTLVYYRDHWYLDAWCHRRQKMRTFMLSRISSAVVMPDVASEFAEEELEQYFHNSYGIFSGAETDCAEITFLPGAAHLVAQLRWHPDAEGHWDGDQYHLRLPFNDSRELLRDLLSYAPDVVINAPDSLRSAYRKRLQEGLSRNL